MTRTTDCLKCNFPRDEPKGNRVCKKCARLESQPKGSAHRGNITIISATGVQTVTEDFLPPARNPLAAFLDAPGPGPGEVALAVAQANTREAQQRNEEIKALTFIPPGAPSNTAEPSVTSEGAIPAATVVASPVAEVPTGKAENGDPPTSASDVTLPPDVVLPGASLASTLPVTIADRGHSPFGGSRAKQFMNCTGSTTLIQQLGLTEDDTESEYSKEGTQAHALVAWCLEHEIDAAWVLEQDRKGGAHQMWSLVKTEDAPHVQSYIDYVRSRPGRRRYEVGFHRPELHDLYWGMIDAELIPVAGVQDHVLEIVDYKHGAGVYVPVQRNEQLMYYAAGCIMEDESFFPDEGVVRLTIAQPRIDWAPEPIRSWDTTVGGIKRWLREELLPAMNVKMLDLVLSLGPWCQFCPAKLVCRAMTELYKVFSMPGVEPLAMSDEQLGSEFSQAPLVRMRIKALEQEVLRRLMSGGKVPFAQLEKGKTDRVWKPDAPLVLTFPGAAYTEPKLRSPAQIEALPGGKEFVAAWAFQPEAPLRVGLAGGKPAVQLPSPEERYGDAVQYLVANKTA